MIQFSKVVMQQEMIELNIWNCPLDNAGKSVIGNIIDTTVSDRRLNTKIKDIETNFPDCVKNVQDIELVTLRSYVAQELQKHLPDQCKHKVKETQKQDEVPIIHEIIGSIVEGFRNRWAK